MNARHRREGTGVVVSIGLAPVILDVARSTDARGGAPGPSRGESAFDGLGPPR